MAQSQLPLSSIMSSLLFETGSKEAAKGSTSSAGAPYRLQRS